MYIKPNLFPLYSTVTPIQPALEHVFCNLCSNPLFENNFSRLSLNTSIKAWIISFGKVTSFSNILIHPTILFQPDLRYYLSLGTRSPLDISQSQTLKAHTIMGDIRRTAMTSISKSSMITFGLVFYCES